MFLVWQEQVLKKLPLQNLSTLYTGFRPPLPIFKQLHRWQELPIFLSHISDINIIFYKHYNPINLGICILFLIQINVRLHDKQMASISGNDYNGYIVIGSGQFVDLPLVLESSQANDYSGVYF